MDHCEDKIKACIDGELPSAEAEAVRTHCRLCASCARVWAQIEAVHRVLSDVCPIEEPESIWPQVAARLRGTGLRSRRRPLLQPAFALGAAVAVVAGLAAGLVLGPGRAGSESDDAAGTAYLTDGSLLADEVATTLDEVYLAASYDGE